jgi:pyruvate formate lyase activating enzyme
MKKREFIKGLLCAGGSCLLCGWKTEAASGTRAAAKNYVDEREASHYSPTPRGVKCLICPNECNLKDGELSVCRNRIARGGKLFTMAYGNPCAIHIDPVEKKPLLHFHPESLAFSIATAGCNFACLNCQNWEISQSSPTETRNEKAGPEAVVAAAARERCLSIAYTYSEPVTFFEYMRDTAILARARGVKNIMVSNGYINPRPLLELCKVMDAANIDLKSFDPDVHLKLTGGKIEPVLATLKTMKEQGVWLEITNLVVPTYNDDLKDIAGMAKWIVKSLGEKTPLHLARFVPEYKLKNLPPTPVQTLTDARKAALDAGLQYVYCSNVAPHEGNNTFCPKCGKVLVQRVGFKILSNEI